MRERRSKMRKVWLAVAIAAISWWSSAAAQTAKVEEGVLQGTVDNGLTIYRGVPFAAPPLGDLRWRAPQPAAQWEGVRAADKFAPQCIQGIPGITTSEDCLYLNVWTRLSQPPRSSRCWCGSMAADLWSGEPPLQLTAERSWPRRELCSSASPIAWARSAFSRIRH